MTTIDVALMVKCGLEQGRVLLCDFNTFQFSLVPDPCFLRVWIVSQTMNRFPLSPPRSRKCLGLTYVLILTVFS